MKFLERDFPSLVPRYEKLYAKKYPPEGYRKEVQAMVQALQQRYGVNERKRPVSPEEPEPADETQVGFAW